MKKVMIHILLSTYNGERWLAEQLDSLLSQTYTDWRLYVRDDGSGDGTCSILKAYAQKDARITVIEEAEKLGAKRSFMYLLEQFGEADYFAFADQDDVWDFDKLALCVKTMQEQEKRTPAVPIVVHTDLRVVDEHLQPIAPSFWQYCNIRPKLLDNNIHYMALCSSVTGCAMLFNRAARACALPMRENAFMHDLWIAQRTLLNGGYVIPLYRTTVAYRQHGSNVLGATRYTAWGKSLRKRIEEVQFTYSVSHPEIFANKLQFCWWKIKYTFHRLFTSENHG